jgi:hypothetical protein
VELRECNIGGWVLSFEGCKEFKLQS